MAESTSFVGANVRRIRDQRGWTLAELAGRLSELGITIHVSGLSNVESGRRRITVEEMLAIAFALDVSPAALVLGEGEPLVVAPGVQLQGMASIQRWFAGLGPLETHWSEDGDKKVTVDGRVISVEEAEELRAWFEANRSVLDRQIEATPGVGQLVRHVHGYAVPASMLRLLKGSGAPVETELREAVSNYLRWLNRAVREQAEQFDVDLNEE
jgi:transcriptional regulator with XRE-family HTH domain